MSKVELRTLESVTGNDAAATALLNANFEEISEALDNVISRDGTAPNYMDANLDMNNKRLINLADPENDYDAINKKYFTDTIGNAASYASQAATSAAAAASSAQSSATSAAQAIAELQAAEATIQEAADRAIEEVEGRAEANIEEYVENTVKPDLHDMVNDASSYATAASDSATLAERWATSTTVVADGKYGSLYYAQQADSANTDAQSAKTGAQSARNTAQTAASNANIWAEGTDEQVQALGGIHSSKVWSTFGKYYVGQIVESPLPIADASLHLLDGSLILGGGIYDDFVTYIAGLVSNYPDCFTTEANWQQAVTDYGVCGKFVYDSVNNTVRLPKYNSKIYTGGGTAPVVGNGYGLTLTDGSQTVGLAHDSNSANVAIGATNQPYTLVGTATTRNSTQSAKTLGVPTASQIGNNLALSGLVAQLSDITTSLDGYYYIVVATSVKTEIEVDIDQITVDLANKANKDVDNLSAAGKKVVANLSFPSSTYVDLTLNVSNSEYTAPANGYYYICKGAISKQFIDINNITANYRKTMLSSNDNQCLVIMPVQKNDVIKINYTATGNLETFRFIYAQGEI